MLSSPPLGVHQLSKKFGKFVALDDVSLSVSPGEIVGLLGPNGAGKSTLMKCITGLLRPTSGSVHIGDAPARSSEANGKIGYIPEVPSVYDLLTPWEHMQFTALAFGLRDWKPVAEDLLERFDLDDKRNSLAGELSKGMRQKILIACALLHQPALYLFDEPTVGLDPQAQRELTDEMRRLRAEGAALLVSTHILAQIERLADRAVILNHGKIVAAGTLDELRQTYNLPVNSALEDVFLQVTE
jgi:ABC-2 type transport system ATP-binding protein